MVYKPYIKNSNGTLTELQLQAEIANKLGSTTKGNSRKPIYLVNGVATECSDIVEIIYPVGAIYLSVNSTNPGTLFGGTWEQIQDKFLLSAGSTYTAGSTGGEATHTLTSNEMPSHNHQIWSCNNWSGNVLGATHSDKVAGVGFVENRGYNETWYNTRSGGQQIIQNTGGGQAHNNMPPYLTVYMWKRIS